MDAILEATARVLIHRGWSGTTTNHIAEQAGVSVGTLYEYFPGKEALVTTLVLRHLEDAETRLRTVGAELVEQASRFELGLRQLVSTLVSVMVVLHAEAPRLHRVLFEEVPHPPSVRTRLRALEDSHAADLAALLSVLPGVRVDDPTVAARLVVEVLESLTHRWITSAAREPIPRARMQQELERLLLAYLTQDAS